jgi:hypothetical protein
MTSTGVGETFSQIRQEVLDEILIEVRHDTQLRACFDINVPIEASFKRLVVTPVLHSLVLEAPPVWIEMRVST